MAALLMNWKSTVLVSGAGLVATLFGWVSTPTLPQRSPAPSAIPVAQPTAPAAAADIQHEAARLQSRLVPESTYRQPSRNPFRFAPRPTPRAADRPIAPVQEPAIVLPPAPVRPTITLRGIASDMVDGAMQRTAIVTTDAGLMLVREGEAAGSYRVTKIEDESVELTGPDGSLTLSLSNPKLQIPNPKPQ
jgi:hypothetical protein